MLADTVGEGRVVITLIKDVSEQANGKLFTKTAYEPACAAINCVLVSPIIGWPFSNHW